ncbi:class I adenylate-forming enzyme family protein [Micromonospora sp. KC723]|uniref:class I adenylate-forming enzyme family protein n=1 Tax=Micromonospora sp. KC723 TaxID=2530381 RepID=UPI001051DC71|nr:fatty acid--CoA ligase family protein [Micromonospora sp. KC723]TDB74906.1 acyl--CoA ligase [Micromonospora sp. KC723]
MRPAEGRVIDGSGAASGGLLTELRRRRDERPHAAAIRTARQTGGDHLVTWAQLYDAARAVVAGAVALPPGAPVLVIVDNTPASAAALIGLTAAGVDVLPVEEGSSYLADLLAPARNPGVRTVVGPDGAAGTEPAGIDFLSYERCRADPVGAGGVPARRPGEVLQLTSGSAGEPKIVRHPVDNVRHGGHTYRQILGLTPADVLVAAVPLAHSFGLVGALAAAVVSGAGLRTMRRFQPGRVADALTEDATVLFGTPLLYRLLTPVLRRRATPARLRAAVSSGGPLAADLGERARAALGVPVCQFYGSTETGLISYQPDFAGGAPDPSVGVPAPGVRLRLVSVDPDGAPGVGHLSVRTPTLFHGYLGASGPVTTPDGFYDTGDLARIDTGGRLHLLGRKDTFVNVGGRKVNPTRVARVLGDHPGVRDVFVFGATDAGGEQRVQAAVVLGPGTGPAELAEHCRTRGLAPYEVPHEFHRLPRLPRTAMGKVDRQAVVAAVVPVPIGSEA